MGVTTVEKVPVARLRAECLHLGIPYTGLSRSDMCIELQNKGLIEVDLSFPAKPPKIDVTNRKDDLSNTFVGNGAGLHETRPNRLVIANNDTTTPLIGGDFVEKRVEITDVLNIASSAFESTTEGQEGDLRRSGNQLYMYRSTDVHPGWYPIRFGPVMVI